jgi:hypothetical protein
MIAIIATTVYFRVPMTTEAKMGFVTSFFGFGAFTFYRNMRLHSTSVLKQASRTKDSSV